MDKMILIEVEIPKPAVCEIEAEAEPNRECVVECKERRILDHEILINREKEDQHPMGAITGLQIELNKKATKQSLNEEIERATMAEQELDERIDNIPQPDLSPYAKKSELARVATSGQYADLDGKPTIPSQASEVHALPDTTKYGASLSVGINPTTYVMTIQLKDQDGNNIGSPQTVDLPLESVVVDGSYDSVNKKIILTLQNGSTIDVPVGDLVSGLQTEITAQNKLDSDLVDDTNSENKFVTANDKDLWNNAVQPSALDGYADTSLSNLSDTGKSKLSYYGTCDTAAATQQKDVVCDGFELKTGVSIRVKFTNNQNYNGNPLLNVNGTGAISIKRYGTTNAARYEWDSGEVLDFTYDGTNWIINNGAIATTSVFGKVQLSTSATTTWANNVASSAGTINSLVQNMIEPYAVYSASSTYKVGDRVRYSYQAWECNTAITTAESWTAAHWTALPAIQDQLDVTNNRVSNVIIDIPQDIKLTLENGTLTLNSGSVITYPDGTQKKVTTDRSVTLSVDGIYFAFTNSSINATLLVKKEYCFSGTSEPTGMVSGTYYMWLDTENGIMKRTNNAGSTWQTGYSLTLGIVTVSNGTISSIDKVFNGFGYIGHHAFVLPDVKVLMPNGFNEDGTLRSYNRKLSSLQIKEITTNIKCVVLAPSTTNQNVYCYTKYKNSEVESYSDIVPSAWNTYYVRDENKTYGANGQGVLSLENSTVVVNLSYDGTTVTQFDIRPVYRAVTKEELDTKQDKLVSGTNIKTVNGNSLLGSGNIDIQAPSNMVTTDTEQTISRPKYFSDKLYIGNKNDQTEKIFWSDAPESFYIQTFYNNSISANLGMYAGDDGSEIDIEAFEGDILFHAPQGSVKSDTPTDDNTTSTQIDTVGARNTKLQNYVNKKPDGTNDLIVNNKVSDNYLPVSDVTVNGTSVVSNGVAVIPEIPTSSDYWTVGTSGVSDYQTTYSKKTIFYTASGAQDNGFKMLASSDTAPSSTTGAWSGRCLLGNEKRTFLLGTARNSASGSQSICGLGAHTWASASSQTSAAWDNVYIQPDGSTGVYLGGYGWYGSSGWFRTLNNNSGSAAYRTSINTGTNSSPAWKTVLPNNTTASNSILFTPTVSTTHSYTYSTSVNGTVTANYGTSYGYGSSAGSYGTALGYNAKATGANAIQLGQGTNSTANTLYVGLSSSLNVQLLEASGVIPIARIDLKQITGYDSTVAQTLKHTAGGNIEWVND